MIRTVEDGSLSIAIEPGEPDVKLFVIDGFTLVAERGPNDAGEGWGIRYSTTVKGIEGVSMSVWIGNSNDENTALTAQFDEAFNTLDEAKARAGLDQLLKYTGPFIARRLTGGDED